MAKRTAIIDLGSRSYRLSIFEKTSRFGFFELRESKANVGIGKKIHQNNGVLLEEDFKKSVEILQEFADIISSLKVNKVLCVATSIIRNAPNKLEFKKTIEKKTGIKIKIIDGESEAYLGALAAVNLLGVDNFVTMDIGGGSTEFALVENKKIKKCFSVDLGAVRLKSMFGDDFSKASEHIKNLLNTLPKDFQAHNLVSIGGTARSIAKSILPSKYPIPIIHGFEFDGEDLIEQCDRLVSASRDELSDMKISNNRLDYIKMGALVYKNSVETIKSKHITTSGVGVREGVYLQDLLRGSGNIFPSNFHIGVRSIEDRFIYDKKLLKVRKKTISRLFDILKNIHNIDEKFKKYLNFSMSLLQSSQTFNLHKVSDHSSYIITHSNVYNLTHVEKMILSLICRYSSKKIFSKTVYENVCENTDMPLPCYNDLKWLSYMNILIFNLCSNAKKSIEFDIVDNSLVIKNLSLIDKQVFARFKDFSDLNIVID